MKFLVFFLAVIGSPVLAEARESLNITCLIHEDGKDRLTEQEFILVDGLEQILFFENKITYTAAFHTEADWEDKRLSAVTIEVSDPAHNLRSSARTTFKTSEGFSQLRIDIRKLKSKKPGTERFYLCHGKPLP